MRKGHILLVFTMLVALLMVPTGAVLAECEDPSLEDALARSSVAFIGVVTDASFDSDTASLHVEWIWKGGDLADDVVVKTPGADPYPFRVGATYIVIPQDTTAPFELAQCSGTRMYRADGELVPEELQGAVGTAMGRVPGTELSDPEDTGSNAMSPLLVALGLGVIAVGAIVFRRLRSRVDSDERSERHWRRVGGPLTWSVRSGGRQVGRMRRAARARRDRSPD